MQFSVIVEGPMDSDAGSENALLELERFLRTSDISSEMLRGLKQGQPKVLKNQLSYDQAVTISDRLIDLGLDSIIDPPIKPDSDDEKSASVSNITTLNPKTQKASLAAKKTAKPASRDASVNPALRQSSKQNHSGKTTAVKPIKRKPNLAAVQTVKPENSPRKQSLAVPQNRHPTPPMATVAATRSTLASASAKKKSKQSSSDALTAKPNLPTNRSVDRSKPAAAPKTTTHPNIAKPQNGPAASPLAKAASEVKSLFQLPKEGTVSVMLPLAARVKFILIASLCCAVPVFYACIWIALLYVSAALGSALFTGLSEFSLVLALTLAAMPWILFSTAFTLTNFPLWLNRKRGSTEFALRAKDEARLFMLATALSKVFKTPSITSIALDNSAQVGISQACAFKEMFNLKEPLQQELKLTLGASLVQNLSIRDVCALIAQEMGVFANPTLRRPYWIVQALSEKFGAFQEPDTRFQRMLSNIHEKHSFSMVRNLIATAANLSKNLHFIARVYFQYSSSLIEACLPAVNSIGKQYRFALTGTENDQDLEELIIHVEANHESAVNEMLENNEKSRYIDNIAQFAQFLLEKNGGKALLQTKKSIGTHAIVSSTQQFTTLLKHFNTYSQKVTKKEYLNAGLNIDEIKICSLESLFQHEQKDQKFTQAASDYFGNWQHPMQFWRLPSENLLPTNDQNAIINRLNNCIARVRYISPDRSSTVQRFDKTLEITSELKAAKKINASGNTFQFQRCGESARSLDRDLNQRQSQARELQEELKQHNTIMGERLALGLVLNQQQKEFSTQILQALSRCQLISEKTISLVIAVEELSHILRHKPKNQAQQYQLYVRELTEHVSEIEKSIRKKLLQCPYDMIDRRYQNLAQFISAQHPQESLLNQSHEQLIISKANDTLAAVNWGYKQLNLRAAFIASAMEKKYGIEKIKKT